MPTAFTNIREAMRVASTGQFDVALLDLNLSGQKARALPGTLKARGKPFGFITGCGQAGALVGAKGLEAPVVFLIDTTPCLVTHLYSRSPFKKRPQGIC